MLFFRVSGCEETAMARKFFDWFWWELYTAKEPKDACRTSFSIRVGLPKFTRWIPTHFNHQTTMQATGQWCGRWRNADRVMDNVCAAIKPFSLIIFRLTQNTHLRIDRFCLLKCNTIRIRAWALVLRRPEMKWKRRIEWTRTWCRILSTDTRTCTTPQSACDMWSGHQCVCVCVNCEETQKRPARPYNVKNLIYTFPCWVKFICSFVTDINFQHPNK